MWECPNVRKRFDVNTSKSQYTTDKIVTPFGPFFCSSTLNPAFKTGLLSSCLGTVGVFPSSLFCHLECSVSFFLSTFWVQMAWEKYTGVFINFEFHQFSSSTFLDNSLWWAFLLHQLWWFVHVEYLFLILRLSVKKSHAVFKLCRSNCVSRRWKWFGEVTPAGESTSTETWKMKHLTLAVV